jgi:hypothetical protein
MIHGIKKDFIYEGGDAAWSCKRCESERWERERHDDIRLRHRMEIAAHALGIKVFPQQEELRLGTVAADVENIPPSPACRDAYLTPTSGAR